MSAGIFDVNGKPLIQPRNVMTEFNKVADGSFDKLPSIDPQDPISMTNPQNSSHAKMVPVTERAIQESQLAVKRELEKKRKLEDFQRRTKKAAK